MRRNASVEHRIPYRRSESTSRYEASNSVKPRYSGSTSTSSYTSSSSSPYKNFSTSSGYDSHISRPGLLRTSSSSFMSSYKPTPMSGSMSSSYHQDYSRNGATARTDYSSGSRYSSNEKLTSYKPNTVSMSSSITIGSNSNRTSGIGNTVSSSSTSSSYIPPKRSTSYTGLTSDSLSGYSKYGKNSTSSYTPSYASSYAFSRGRFEIRSQTPSYSTESSTTMRRDRDYQSMSRFSRERSITRRSEDRAEEDVDKTFEKLYNKYVKNATETSSSENSKASSPKPTKKFISHSEAEEETEEESSEEATTETDSDAEFSKILQRKKEEYEKGKSSPTKDSKDPPTPRASADKESTPTAKITTSIKVEGKSKEKPNEDAKKMVESKVADAKTTSEIKKVPTQPPSAAVQSVIKVEAKIDGKNEEKNSKAAPTTVAKKSEPSGKVVITKVISSELKKSDVQTKTDPKKESSPGSAVSSVLKTTAPKATTISTIKKVEIKTDPVTEAKDVPKATPANSAASPKVLSSVTIKTVTPSDSAKNVAQEHVKTGKVMSISINGKPADTSPPKSVAPNQNSASNGSKSLSTSMIDSKGGEKPTDKQKMTTSLTNSLTASNVNNSNDRRKARLDRTMNHLCVKLENLANGETQEEKKTKKSNSDEPHEQITLIVHDPNKTSSLNIPVLMVTQPSLPSTPQSKTSAWDYETASDEESEEYTDEDEEEEFVSDSDEFDVSQTIDLSSFNKSLKPQGDLYPVDGSPTPSDYFDSEFEFTLPFNAPQRSDSRNRVPEAKSLPPPVFVASVSYDGMDSSWDSAKSDSLGTEDDTFYQAVSRLDVDRPGSDSRPGSGMYLSPASFTSDEEFVDTVDVNCTLTLVERAAMKGSDEETDDESEYYESDEYDEDEEEYTDEEYEEDEEEEESDEAESFEEEEEYEDEEEYDEDVDASVSLYLPAVESSMQDSQISSKSIIEERLREATVEPVQEDVFEEQMDEFVPEAPAEPSSARLTEIRLEKDKKIQLVEAYVKPLEEKKEPERADPFKPTKPKTDFAKKAVVQPMKSESVKVEKPKLLTADSPKPKEESKPIPVVKVEEVKAPPKETTKTATAKVERDAKKIELEDKSAIRKSELNMSESDRKKAEQKQQELAKQKARGTGTVSAMKSKFGEPEVQKPEPITYKRSSRLEPKEDRPKRVIAPVIKPVIDDDFDKQMKELREQIQSGTKKFESEFIDLSKGMYAKTDETRMQAMETQHKELINKASTVFSKADSEKKRWQEQRESDAEKKKQDEIGKEKAKLTRLEEEKKAQKVITEAKKTIRRSKKEEIEAKLGDPSAPSTSSTGLSQPGTPKAARRLSSAQIASPKNSPTPSRKLMGVNKKDALQSVENKSGTPSELTPERILHKRYVRNRTQEMMHFSNDTEGTTKKKAKKRRRHPHPPNRFIRKPFDIDVLLGWNDQNASFEQMEAFFEKESKVKYSEKPYVKKRKVEHQKVWISELKDIDKIYKTSELRDIKLSVGA